MWKCSLRRVKGFETCRLRLSIYECNAASGGPDWILTVIFVTNLMGRGVSISAGNQS